MCFYQRLVLYQRSFLDEGTCKVKRKKLQVVTNFFSISGQTWLGRLREQKALSIPFTLTKKKKKKNWLIWKAQHKILKKPSATVAERRLQKPALCLLAIFVHCFGMWNAFRHLPIMRLPTSGCVPNIRNQ